MGLLRRLLGREPAWVERWAVYPGEIGDGLAMYNIDLGAVEAAPVARLPQRLDVDFTYAGDGAAACPPTPNWATIHALDEAVRQALRGARRRDGRPGRHGRHRPHHRLPARRRDRTRAARLPGAVPASSRSARTRAGPGSGDELTPDAWQRNIMDDNQVVQELEGHGDRLSQPRPVEFLGVLPRPPTTPRRPPRTCATSGFAVTVERGDEADFVLQAIRRDAVEPPALHEVTWEVRGVVERHDGMYDGWGCMVQA